MKWTPDDLYDLAVADVRELREQRKRVEKELKAWQAWARGKGQKGAKGQESDLVKRGMEQLDRLRERLASGNVKVSRHAIQESIERVDLWFEHVKSAKITRSVFKEGRVKFRSTFPLELSEWPACASGKLQDTLFFRARDLGPVQFDHRTAPSVEAGAEFLRGYLAGGPRPWVEIVEAGRRLAGVSQSSLRRAAKRLGVKMAGGLWWLAG